MPNLVLVPQSEVLCVLAAPLLDSIIGMALKVVIRGDYLHHMSVYISFKGTRSNFIN